MTKLINIYFYLKTLMQQKKQLTPFNATVSAEKFYR